MPGLDKRMDKRLLKAETTTLSSELFIPVLDRVVPCTGRSKGIREHTSLVSQGRHSRVAHISYGLVERNELRADHTTMVFMVLMPQGY